MEKKAGETGSAPHTLAALGVKSPSRLQGRGLSAEERRGFREARGASEVVLDHPGALSVLRGFLVEQ